MSTFFISRHPGAVEWARRQGLAVDRWEPHLDVDGLQPGDTVIGTLPVHLAAQVCARGARYLHLSLDLPVAWRGRELSAEELTVAGARLEAYCVGPDMPAPRREGDVLPMTKAQRLVQVREDFLKRLPPQEGRSLAEELIRERHARAEE